MESLFEKEIKIIDNKRFWDEYKLETMKRGAYLKENYLANLHKIPEYKPVVIKN